MRTAEEFRDRKLEILAHSLRRPQMWAECANDLDVFYSGILDDLVWLEDRPKSETRAAYALITGPMRVFGQFFYQNYKNPSRYLNEVASTYAEVAFRLGYFTPTRLMTLEEFHKLQRALDDNFFKQDRTLPEIEGCFGKACHEVGCGDTLVHCYACEDRQLAWVYFDYSRCYPQALGEWFTDPILRDVRRSANKFELLPFAEWFRSDEEEFGRGNNVTKKCQRCRADLICA